MFHLVLRPPARPHGWLESRELSLCIRDGLVLRVRRFRPVSRLADDHAAKLEVRPVHVRVVAVLLLERLELRLGLQPFEPAEHRVHPLQSAQDTIDERLLSRGPVIG